MRISAHLCTICKLLVIFQLCSLKRKLLQQNMSDIFDSNIKKILSTLSEIYKISPYEYIYLLICCSYWAETSAHTVSCNLESTVADIKLNVVEQQT